MHKALRTVTGFYDWLNNSSCQVLIVNSDISILAYVTVLVRRSGSSQASE